MNTSTVLDCQITRVHEIKSEKNKNIVFRNGGIVKLIEKWF